MIPLQSATAADTVRVLSSLVAQGGDAGGPNLHMVADDRSNSVLISGDPTMRLKIRALIANLDTPLDTGGETLVRYLNYARAEDLAAKLKEQISSNSNAASGGANRPNAVVTRVVAPTPTSAASATTVSLAGGTGTIWADKDTNALIITARQRTMRALNAVIDKLDIRRAQVVVEAIIVEVSVDKTADLGVNWIVDGTNSRLAVGGFIEPVGGTSIVDLYNAAKTGTPPVQHGRGYRHHGRHRPAEASGRQLRGHAARAAGRFAHQHPRHPVGGHAQQPGGEDGSGAGSAVPDRPVLHHQRHRQRLPDHPARGGGHHPDRDADHQ